MRTKSELNVWGRFVSVFVARLSVGVTRTAGSAACGVVCLLLLAASPAGAGTIYVNGATGDDAWDGLCEEWDGGTCGPKATIQAGIEAAVNGDEVVVADGTYTGPGNKNLDFGGRLIAVRSANGPETCIIDCEGDGRAFHFHSGEGPEAIVDGFTIQHGDAPLGGAVMCEDTSPVLVNLVIRQCSALVGGGVLFRDGGNATIVDCVITQCNGQWDGGGVYADEIDELVLTRCELSSNETGGNGGGVYALTNVGISLTDCYIHENTAEFNGGGALLASPSNPIESEGCVISSNVAEYYGGGVKVNGVTRFSECVVYNNGACYSGGGVCCTGGLFVSCTIRFNFVYSGNGAGINSSTYDLAVVGCSLAHNEVFEGNGGALRKTGGALVIINSLLSDNRATSGSAVAHQGQECGIYGATIVDNTAESLGAVWLDSAPSLRNCVFWGNTATDGVPNLYASSDSGSIDYCCVEGGLNSVYAPSVQWGSGNIAEDPGFIDSAGGDYRLQCTSPCIDSGSNDALPEDAWDLDNDGNLNEPVPLDLAGWARICNEIVDIGAYESHLGDVNCDLMRDFDDISPFVLALSGQAGYEVAYPNCDWLNADCNVDGTVDFDDITDFVNLLSD